MIFSSNRPISFYLFTVANLALNIYIGIASNTLFSPLLYGSIIFIFGYWYFLKGNYLFQLYPQKIIIKNCLNSECINFQEIISYDYYRNGWNVFTFRMSPSIVDKPYDTLFLEVLIEDKIVVLEFHLNFFIFQFSKLLEILKKSSISDNIPLEVRENAQLVTL